ncbi:MAG: DoxX family protein [Mycobacterium sp.]
MTIDASYLAVTLIAVAANGFSGIAALLHFQPILAGMAKADVPLTWLTFPIGTLKTAGALGLAAGLAFPPLGVAAAIGLVLFFVCAVYTHIRAEDYGPQFFLAIGFLALNVAALVVALAYAGGSGSTPI